MTSEEWIVQDVDGSSNGLILDTIPEFSWSDWEKTMKNNQYAK